MSSQFYFEEAININTVHCLVTEESEAGEEEALAPVLVAAPGALVVELERKAM